MGNGVEENMQGFEYSFHIPVSTVGRGIDDMSFLRDCILVHFQLSAVRVDA